MKINWKHLSATKGYRSLKQCVIFDITKHRRTKEETYKLFKKVIGRAISIVERENRRHITKTHAVELLLNKWEKDRTYWWVNYYSDYHFKKGIGNVLKPIGIKGIRNLCKTDFIYSKGASEYIHRYLTDKRKKSGKKGRWTNKRKKENCK